MNRISSQRPHAENCLKCIGPRAQMLDRPEIFQRVPLRLQRIIRGGSSLQRDRRRLNFKRLLCLRRSRQHALGDHCGADIPPADLSEIFQPISIDDLQCLKIRSV